MKTMDIFKRVGSDILKGLAASLAAFVGLIIGGRVTQLLNLPAPAMPANVSMTVLMPLMILSGITIAVVLGECFQKLSWQFLPRLLAITLCNYLLYYALNTLDGMLFSPIANMSTGFVLDLFPALFTALIIAWLWRPQTVASTRELLGAFFSAHPGSQWAWRLLAAWLIYPPIYYLIGRIVGLFTQHYYEDPSLNLGLTLPDLGTLMLMQVLRGALFLLAVAPVLIAGRGKLNSLWLWVGAVIFVQISIQIILQAYWLPLALRAPHTIELCADALIQAVCYVGLLVPLKGGALSQLASSH